MEYLIYILGMMLTFLRTIHLYPYNLYAILTLTILLYFYSDLSYQYKIIEKVKRISQRIIILEKQNMLLLKFNKEHYDCYVENKRLLEELKKKDEIINMLKEDRQKNMVAL